MVFLFLKTIKTITKKICCPYEPFKTNTMKLKNKKIAILTAELFEDLELWYPAIRLKEAGAEVVLAGEQANKTFTGKNGVPAKTEISFDQLKEGDFDGLIVPGGFGPDKLRRDKYVTAFVKKMDEAGKPIGQICHAGWVQISAGILKGRKVTSYVSIRDDMENAGANWVDEAVVVDKNLVSSRTPHDLHVFVPAFIDLF